MKPPVAIGSAPVRYHFLVEATLPQDRPAEALEWLQKFFDYFHPKLCATVKVVEPAAEQPAESCLD